MPVQLVKIDRTLLDDVGIDPRATALARSVVAMARDLGLLVVAEGMEDMASVRLLRDLGAYAGQGFALSPALPADRMAQVLAGPPLDLEGSEPFDSRLRVLTPGGDLESVGVQESAHIVEGAPTGELPTGGISTGGSASNGTSTGQVPVVLPADPLSAKPRVDLEVPLIEEGSPGLRT